MSLETELPLWCKTLQYELLEMSHISGFVDRARGTGRPTKKERRSLDAFVEPAEFGFDFDNDDFDDDE